MSKTKTAEDMVIDGDTLEKRRDQRAEQLERFVGEMTPDDRKGFIGKVNQWTAGEGVKVVDASQSVFDLNSKEKKLRTDIHDEHTFDLPPIEKRTTQQRIESLANRLAAVPEWEQQYILREIQGEYWKAGNAVAYEDLRAVAAALLNKTERKK